MSRPVGAEHGSAEGNRGFAEPEETGRNRLGDGDVVNIEDHDLDDLAGATAEPRVAKDGLDVDVLVHVTHALLKAPEAAPHAAEDKVPEFPWLDPGSFKLLLLLLDILHHNAKHLDDGNDEGAKGEGAAELGKNDADDLGHHVLWEISDWVLVLILWCEEPATEAESDTCEADSKCKFEHPEKSKEPVEEGVGGSFIVGPL